MSASVERGRGRVYRGHIRVNTRAGTCIWRFYTCERLYDDLPDDPPGGGGVPLGGRGHARLLLTGLHGVEVVVLTAELVGDVVAGVRVRQPGHVAVRRV